MNTAIISDRASNSGVGFAVPINQHGAGPLLGELRGGKVTSGVIGVQMGVVPSDYQVLGLDALRGVIVSSLAPDGPADEAGIEPGDVIAAYAGCNACSGTPRCAVVTSAAFACWLTTSMSMTVQIF